MLGHARGENLLIVCIAGLGGPANFDLISGDRLRTDDLFILDDDAHRPIRAEHNFWSRLVEHNVIPNLSDEPRGGLRPQVLQVSL